MHERQAVLAPPTDDDDVLLGALARLGRRQRAVLLLRDQQDWSDKDIASSLGCSCADRASTAELPLLLPDLGVTQHGQRLSCPADIDVSPIHLLVTTLSALTHTPHPGGRMDDAWLGLAVVLLLAVAVVVALVYDFRSPSRSRRPSDVSDVSDERLRRAQELDARHQSPGSSGGFMGP